MSAGRLCPDRTGWWTRQRVGDEVAPRPAVGWDWPLSKLLLISTGTFRVESDQTGTVFEVKSIPYQSESRIGNASVT